MPAIFGWMTLDDQVEHAREIADLTRNDIKKNNDNEDVNKSYQVAKISENELEEIKQLENKLNKNKNDNIFLVAFRK